MATARAILLFPRNRSKPIAREQPKVCGGFSLFASEAVLFVILFLAIALIDSASLGAPVDRVEIAIYMCSALGIGLRQMRDHNWRVADSDHACTWPPPMTSYDSIVASKARSGNSTHAAAFQKQSSGGRAVGNRVYRNCVSLSREFAGVSFLKPDSGSL
ncbi:MAG: hypothetical protein ACREQH_08640 [Candidatus Binatus sp.]